MNYQKANRRDLIRELQNAPNSTINFFDYVLELTKKEKYRKRRS